MHVRELRDAELQAYRDEGVAFLPALADQEGINYVPLGKGPGTPSGPPVPPRPSTDPTRGLGRS